MIAPVPPSPPAIVRLADDPAAAPSDTITAASVSPGGFVHHLLEALAVNAQRAPIYARQSQGRSWPMSLRLMASEVFLIPAGWVFDGWGGTFRAQGLPAVAGDFTSMSRIAAVDRPFSPIHPLRPVVWTELKAAAAFYGDVIRFATEARDFRLVCQACEAMMDKVDRIEATEGVPLMMTRHVLESLGYAAVHALALGQRSHGETDGLYTAFLGLQGTGIVLGIDFDRAVTPLHADGVGFLVNDLPHIPFREAWDDYRQSSEAGAPAPR